MKSPSYIILINTRTSKMYFLRQISELDTKIKKIYITIYRYSANNFAIS